MRATFEYTQKTLVPAFYGVKAEKKSLYVRDQKLKDFVVDTLVAKITTDNKRNEHYAIFIASICFGELLYVKGIFNGNESRNFMTVKLLTYKLE